MAKLGISIPDELNEKLHDYAAKIKKPASKVIRMALWEFFLKSEKFETTARIDKSRAEGHEEAEKHPVAAKPSKTEEDLNLSALLKSIWNLLNRKMEEVLQKDDKATLPESQINHLFSKPSLSQPPEEKYKRTPGIQRARRPIGSHVFRRVVGLETKIFHQGRKIEELQASYEEMRVQEIQAREKEKQPESLGSRREDSEATGGARQADEPHDRSTTGATDETAAMREAVGRETPRLPNTLSAVTHKESHIGADPGNQKISYQPSDPLAKGLVLEEISLPGRADDLPDFHVEGSLPAPATYPVGSIEFQKLQVETIIIRALEAMRPGLGKMPSWFEGMELAVHPRAGKGLDAFYSRSRKELFFLHDMDPERNKMVYASESADTVAHQIGHAILDSIKPQLFHAPFSEVAALHESFADITAFLTALADFNVRKAVLEMTGGNLREPNPAAYFAEELGHALYHYRGSEHAASGDYLRSAINGFRYTEPSTLHDDAPDSRLSPDPHSFSRIFTAAVYDILICAYEKLAKERKDTAALERARQLLAKLVVNGIRLACITPSYYQSVAKGIMQADATINEAALSQQIFQIFTKRRILTIAKGQRRTGFASFGLVKGGMPMRLSLPEGKLRIGVGASGKWDRFIAAARTEIGVPSNAALEIICVSDSPSGILVEMASKESIELIEPEFSLLRGAVVDVPGSIVTQFSHGGKLLAVHAAHPNQADIRKVKDYLKRIVRKGEAAYIPAWPDGDVRWLASHQKPWVVMQDAEGVKRLRRAYFA